MAKRKASAAAKTALGRLFVAAGATASTVLLFFALSVINEIAGGERPDMTIRSADSVVEKPPQDVLDEPEPEPDEPEEPDEPPPELEQDTVEDLTLSQLEAAANAATGFGAVAGDFAIDLSKVVGGGGSLQQLFDASELDNAPKRKPSSSPPLSAAEKKLTPALAVVVFKVDKKGRVVNPIVKKINSPGLKNAVLRTVKGWRFFPGTVKGVPVEYKVSCPFEFPDMKNS